MRALTLIMALAATPASAVDLEASGLELCRRAIAFYDRDAPPAERARFRAIERNVARMQQEKGHPRALDIQAEQTFRDFRAGRDMPFKRERTSTTKGYLVERFCHRYE